MELESKFIFTYTAKLHLLGIRALVFWRRLAENTTSVHCPAVSQGSVSGSATHGENVNLWGFAWHRTSALPRARPADPASSLTDTSPGSRFLPFVDHFSHLDE